MENKQPLHVLFPYEPEVFWEQMRRLIQEEMGKTHSAQTASLPVEEPLLQRKEIAAKLKISLVTLHDWMNRGLPSHKQRGRVYFLYSEVMEYIKKNKIKRSGRWLGVESR